MGRFCRRPCRSVGGDVGLAVGYARNLLWAIELLLFPMLRFTGDTTVPVLRAACPRIRWRFLTVRGKDRRCPSGMVFAVYPA